MPLSLVTLAILNSTFLVLLISICPCGSACSYLQGECKQDCPLWAGSGWDRDLGAGCMLWIASVVFQDFLAPRPVQCPQPSSWQKDPSCKAILWDSGASLTTVTRLQVHCESLIWGNKFPTGSQHNICVGTDWPINTPTGVFQVYLLAGNWKRRVVRKLFTVKLKYLGVSLQMEGNNWSIISLFSGMMWLSNHMRRI